MNKFIYILAVLTVFSFVSTAVYAKKSEKVTICHANNGNGWVQITVDEDAVDKEGNGDHNRSGHQSGRDIIPPGSWDDDGRNWDNEGQAIYNNGCEKPKATPTPTPTKKPKPTRPPKPTIKLTATPTQSVTATPALTVTPTDTPKSEPTSTPTEQPRQSDPAPEVWQFRSEAPICTSLAPIGGVDNFHVYRKGGTAILKWYPDPTKAPTVHLWYYQNQITSNIHAVADVTNTGSFTIEGLGSLDWTFGIQPANGCAASDITWVIDADTSTWTLFRPHIIE